MKICITSEGENIDSQVDAKFGRCLYLQFLDSETLNGTCEENRLREGQGGVGIQVAQQIVEKKVGAVITGNIGPNAAEVLEAAGIPVYLANAQTVNHAVDDFRFNSLRENRK